MSKKQKTPFKAKYSDEHKMWVGTHADYKNIGYRDHTVMGALLGIKRMIGDTPPETLHAMNTERILHR